jgi:hypothetical protein
VRLAGLDAVGQYVGKGASCMGVSEKSSRANMAAPGQRSRSPTLLAEVYGGCTKGLNTADLQEAQARLEELA